MKYILIFVILINNVPSIAQTLNEFEQRLKSYFENSNYSEAIIYIDSVANIEPTCALCYNYKGVIYSQLGKLSLALENFDIALEIADSTIQDQVLAYKGLALRKLRKYQEALVCCDEALKFNPLNADALSVKGEIVLFLHGKVEEGSSLIKKAFELKPNDPNCQFNYARLMIALWQSETALKILNNIPSEGTLKPALFFLTGEAYMQMKNYESALHYYNLAKKYGDDFLAKEVDYITKQIQSLPD